jgi:uncharacterized lipoprotein NlpE involved in copper resistance
MIGLMAATARGDERPVEWKDLPAAVRQAAEKAAAGVKWTGALERSEDNETTYRVKGTDAKGGQVEVTLAADGKVEAVETASRLDDVKDLPAEVRKAAEQSAPGARWAELVVRAEDEETTYRLKGTDAKGRNIEATFTVEVHVQLVETALDLKDLPTPLADAIKPLAGAKWTRAAEKTGEDETTLEAVGTDAKGHEVTVSVTSDGRAKVRTELELGEVPPVVAEALKAKLPMFRPHSVASVAEQGAVTYVFHGEEREDEEMEVSISSDGKTVKIGGDDDDD